VARTALVAALLLTAAAVLYDTPGAPPSATPAPSASSAPPAGSAPPAVPMASSPIPATDRTAPESLPIPAGAVGVPVRVFDPATLAVLRPGDRVDLLATADETTRIATASLVLAVPATADEQQAVVYLAVSPAEARKVVASPPGVRFAVIVRSYAG
jgi:hypothetical protein